VDEIVAEVKRKLGTPQKVVLEVDSDNVFSADPLLSSSAANDLEV
jgi:hypothetical protein